MEWCVQAPAAPRAPRLTHAGDDAVHGQAGGAVVAASARKALLLLLLLLLEDEGRVLLLGDVDVEAGVRRCHDVPRAGVQQDALVLLPPDADQADPVPVPGARGGHSQLEKKPLRGIVPAPRTSQCPPAPALTPRHADWTTPPAHRPPALTSCARGRRRR